MTEKVTLKIEFTVGTLREIGLGGFRIGWLDAENDGLELSLTCGAGMGNGLLEASCNAASGKSEGLYARADIRPLAEALFTELGKRFRARESGDPGTRGESA
jgi:hypothetical protein